MWTANLVDDTLTIKEENSSLELKMQVGASNVYFDNENHSIMLKMSNELGMILKANTLRDIDDCYIYCGLEKNVKIKIPREFAYELIILLRN